MSKPERLKAQIQMLEELLTEKREQYIAATDPAFATTDDPTPKTMADLVTQPQLGLISRLAKEVGVNADEECVNFINCKSHELNKRAASSFIEHLQGLKKREAKSA